MTKEFAAQVLICGAGAAGLTLAVDLARRGVSFRLIEKMDGPFRGSRGKGIQPRTQEIFEDLGIIDRIVAAGARARSPRSRSKSRNGVLDCSRATVHQMHQSAVLPDSQRVCSSCSKACTGRYWAMMLNATPWRHARGCISIQSVRATISLMRMATCATFTV